jgi:hypothetical protein
MGTALFVWLGATTSPDRSDPTRVLGQVVTGIGFLGAGVILTREGRVLGVTTAAMIWVLAAIGSLIGMGHLSTAIVITLTTLAVLLGVEGVESFFEARLGRRSTREFEGPAAGAAVTSASFIAIRPAAPTTELPLPATAYRAACCSAFRKLIIDSISAVCRPRFGICPEAGGLPICCRR